MWRPWWGLAKEAVIRRPLLVARIVQERPHNRNSNSSKRLAAANPRGQPKARMLQPAVESRRDCARQIHSYSENYSKWLPAYLSTPNTEGADAREATTDLHLDRLLVLAVHIGIVAASATAKERAATREGSPLALPQADP